MTFPSVTVVIPALNEEASIGLVLADLPAVGGITVVDNGSTDRTAEVAAAAGARVITEPRRGYGSACLRGLRAIDEDIAAGGPAPEVVAFVDADYSDHPQELAGLIAPILEGQRDFVLGSRILGHREPGAMPPQSLWGNRLACLLMKWIQNGAYTDLGPMRAIRYTSLVNLGMCDRDFGWTVEMQIKALQARLRIEEIPVAYRKRVGASKISGTVSGTIKAGAKILFLIFKYAIFRRLPAARQEIAASPTKE